MCKEGREGTNEGSAERGWHWYTCMSGTAGGATARGKGGRRRHGTAGDVARKRTSLTVISATSASVTSSSPHAAHA